ncbi:MAG: hypothetical protein ACI4E0_13890 [Blautia sp.]
MEKHNKALIYIFLIFVLFDNLLVDFFGVPSAVRYINDVILLLLLFSCIKAIKPTLQQTGTMDVAGAVVLFSLMLIPGVVINGGSPLLILWAVRNNYRFFAFYIVCLCTLDREDIIRILEMLCWLQHLNLAFCLFEYLVLGKTRDYLGGIFGTSKGCNAYLNVYLCIVLCYVIYKYLKEKTSTGYMLYILLSIMLIAGLAELKIVFIEIIIIIAIAILMNRKEKRIWTLLAFGLAAIIVGLLALLVVAPQHFRVLMNLQNLIDYVGSEDGGYYLSRFQAFSNINQLFFRGDWILNLFGMGFGNCEYSSFSFLQSPFYRTYGQYNYRWFMHQMLFLESGYAGLLSYIAIIATVFFNAWRRWTDKKDGNIMHGMTMIMCIITVISVWYNSSMRMECAYMIWLVLAGSSIADKKGRNIELK